MKFVATRPSKTSCIGFKYLLFLLESCMLSSDESDALFIYYYYFLVLIQNSKFYLILPPFHIVSSFREIFLFQNVSSFHISR